MFELMLENSSGNIVDLNDGERYEVISASGLNPPSASIFTSKSPNLKGLKYNGSTLNERIVSIQIKLLGNVEVSRNNLYAWADPEEYTKIRYENGVKKVYCEGHIEVCEVDPFTDNEVMNIEILCENPYWKDLEEISVEITNFLKQFVFPFAISHDETITVTSKNPDGTAAVTFYNKGIPFSSLKDNNIESIINSGAETGVQFNIRCTEDIDSFIIFDADNTTRRFQINYPFKAGWQIIIDTERSPKTCQAISPDGTVLNVLRYVKGNPTWFTLKKGVNRLGYIANDGAAAVEMSVNFTIKYLGI